jgi:hypothetical protein
MFDAVGFNLSEQFRKKKSFSRIIPASFFRKNELTEGSLSNNNSVSNKKHEETNAIKTTPPLKEENVENPGKKINLLSLNSVGTKKQLLESSQKNNLSVIPEEENEPFTENEMHLNWVRFANKLDTKGQKILSSSLQINTPYLENQTILYEVPNQTILNHFESIKPQLLGYLKSKLHNHSIAIEVIINEEVATKNAFTDTDKYNRLLQLNPNIERLKKLFDLYF